MTSPLMKHDVGIDVATKGGETLTAAWPERMPADPAFGRMVAAGRLGRKSKKGFYRYEGDKRAGPDPSGPLAQGWRDRSVGRRARCRTVPGGAA